MEESWFYHKDGRQHGPVDEETVRGMFASGELSARTLVWKKDMSDWQPAGDVAWFVSRGLVPPPVVAPPPYRADGPPAGSAVSAAYEPSGPQVRPWVRYWARMTDILMFSVLFGFVAGFVYPSVMTINGFVLGMVLVFVYMFIEPIMLSSWGSTPGKELFKIRLRRHDGEKLSFSDAMGRSLRVWSWGEGLGIPVVTLITNYISYRQLVETGRTSWDRRGSFAYSHQIVGPARTAAAVVFFVILWALALWGSRSG
jgi:uncharacterized RDD family membrane protein YckC